jgi:cytidine deaminase
MATAMWSSVVGVATGTTFTTSEPPLDERWLVKTLGVETLEAYKNTAISTMDNAYAPYSEYKVGVMIICKDGLVYVGANVENAIGSETIHAEASAIAMAAMSGARKFEYVFIASSTGTSPCGSCRQKLSEFGNPIVVGVTSAGSITFVSALEKLLPHPPNRRVKE